MMRTSERKEAKIAELDALAGTDVREPIPPSKLERLKYRLLIPPPIINGRDIGAVPGSKIHEEYFFRCGTLEYTGQEPAAGLWLGGNTKRIFDLRRREERERAPDPDIFGVENVWLETEGEYEEPSLEEFARGDGSEAWRKQYLSVVQAYTPTFRAVLEHIRDRPMVPILFHCTAGRDRTGVLAGLLHHLAGSDPEVALRDYMLSRIGTEPARGQLLRYARLSTGAEGFDTPGFYNLVSLRPEFWTAFLEGLEETYGGWDGYVLKKLGFSKTDLKKIKKNILLKDY